MGAEEKNRNEILSRIAADLFAATKGSDDLQAKILLLRSEIKKVIESDDTLYGKFRGLVESFREIIPDEKQRFNAAIKALSTTSKVSRQEIAAAVNNQLEELKILEKVLLNTPYGLHNELAAMEARSRQVRDEMAKLRERIGQLEGEEKEILGGMAMREKEVQLVSKAVGDVFTDITTEIAHINGKVREVSAESTAPQQAWTQAAPPQQVPPQQVPPQPPAPVAPPANDAPVQAKETVEQKSEVPEPSEPQYGALQKKCPMCGGRMDLYDNQRLWKCFSCAFEEMKNEHVEQAGGEQKNEASTPSAPQSSEFQRKCPMCGGRMDFYSNQNMWMCFSCAHEETG